MQERNDKMPKDETKQRLSHSAIEAFNACEKRYEYAHVDKLAPKETPQQLALGSYVHKVFEVFFLSIKEGEPDNMAMIKALQAAYQNIAFFDKVGNRMIYWFENVWPNLGWKILEVEATYYLPLNEKEEYPFTVDLIIEVNGQIAIVDHKSTADFYDENIVDIYPQLPKYAGALRALKERGYDVKIAYYNFIRTRPYMKNLPETTAVVPVKLTNDRIKNSFQEHFNSLKKIREHEGPYVRSFGNNCKYCPFIDLCQLEMNGKDSTSLKAIGYKENEYGY
ncbi:RecB-like exonuclease/helicase [Arthrobacter phage Casserole]|nr:RecB-like exonuclease/helicase [Arthrobacter phage Casserole]